ncbi:MAG: nucleotidyltransferase family protein [Muribaculaceae bacterium]|nr:nucleotidyltransferase family protein [Muribaculaceae bacterium]
MKAFVLAAGLGTRLRPFTLEHPKALVPVGGVPMLARVFLRLKDEGFTEIVVNVHHFADQIADFLRANGNFGLDVAISDERDRLLDTGGAILHARSLLGDGSTPFLVHNVDILSDARLGELMQRHDESGAMATLLVSDRDSSRRLCFNETGELCGWHNLRDGALKPEGYSPSTTDRQLAFSGIHVLSPEQAFAEMERQGRGGSFSVIDFYTEACRHMAIKGHEAAGLQIIDIGKPATLAVADSLLGGQR